MSKDLFYIFSATLTMFFKDEITSIVGGCLDFLIDLTVSRIVINVKESPRLVYALKEKLGLQGSRQQAREGHLQPFYDIYPGWYSDGSVKILVTTETITLFDFNSIDALKDYLQTACHNSLAPEHVLTFYVSEKNQWGTPILRRPRNLQLMTLGASPKIQDLLKDTENFMESELRYERQAKAYRRGYLLSGPPGSGKSTFIELLSMTYNMPVYLIHINDDINDATLVTLISQIPPRSLVVIEEIEKQLKTAKENVNNRVSFGGLLSAIDGPQRLAHGIIFVITTNQVDAIDPDFLNPLLREGRIDIHTSLI